MRPDGISGRAAKGLFLIAVSPWIFWAALRLTVLFRRLSLPEVAEHLARGRVFPVPYLRHAPFVVGSVAALSPWLPPFGLGRCLKTSLLLVDLLSRTGAEPHFHLGMTRFGDQRAFHAWLSGPGVPQLEDESAYDEVWSWSPIPEVRREGSLRSRGLGCGHC